MGSLHFYTVRLQRLLPVSSSINSVSSKETMESPIIIHKNCLSLPSRIFQFQSRCSVVLKSKPKPSSRQTVCLTSFPLFRPLLGPRNPHFEVTRAIDADNSGMALEGECGDLVIEASLTRRLPPALTLQHGLQALIDALQELKLHPPASANGSIRFEVAVPPSVNALDWFCCQPESSEAFPQFYICKQSVDPTYESAFMHKTHGVFGIGAAVDFGQTSTSSQDWNSFRRYLLVDSVNITAYGFIGINYDVESFFMKHESGSFYFVIPQIELNEYEDFCLLAGTVVWGEPFPCNFEQALLSYEISLFQANSHIPPMLENGHVNLGRSAIEKFNMVESEKLKMVHMEAQLLGSCHDAAAFVEMVSSSS